MKAQKNTNAEAIKQYLLLAPRTRKEIVKFVACDLNGQCSFSFDDNYKKELRGYYSTFFRDCKHFGTIEKIGNKYQVTKSCLEEGNGLWSMTKDRQIELAKNRISNMHDQWSELRENSREIHILKAELQRVNKVRRSLELELDEANAEKMDMEQSVLMFSGQAKRYAKKLSNIEEKNIVINININK